MPSVSLIYFFVTPASTTAASPTQNHVMSGHPTFTAAGVVT
jgi:hypothetical protein